MEDHRCPIAGECPFIEKIEQRITNLENSSKNWVNMRLFSILVGVLLVVLGSIFALGWAIKTDVAQIDKAVYGQQILLEKHMNQMQLNGD